MITYSILAWLLPAASGAQGFNAVFSRDGTDVWAVGSGGTYYRSLDGGQTWNGGSLGSTGLSDVVARGLSVWVAGDSGKVFRSADSGGSWSPTALAGAPDLMAIAMPSDLTGYVAGAGGALFKTTDGGLKWVMQTSGTSNRLRALRFTDDAHGWAGGDGGTLLTTANGGSTWTPVAAPTTADIRSIDVRGSEIWAVGAFATALRSTDGGAHWNPVDLHIPESKGDVDVVWIEPSTGAVTLAGGGGFIRTTTDGGLTWTFQIHPMLAGITDVFFTGNGLNGWACNRLNRAVLRTTNGGATPWLLPTGCTETTAWSLRQGLVSGSARGDAFSVAGWNRNTVYCALGGRVYKSENRGDTWAQVATIPNVTKTNSFYVAPYDSNLMVAAVDSLVIASADRVVRSVNGGLSWTTTLRNIPFSEYGMPLEMNPDHPDSLLFAPENGFVYASADFGRTWGLLSGPWFRSPCDILIMPGRTRTILVGDGVTGSGLGDIWKSTNGGLSFTRKFIGSGSEIPTLGVCRLNTNNVLATNWASITRLSRDLGETYAAYQASTSSWGVDFARDDPNVTIHGVYSGGLTFLSTDLGATFVSTALGSANYAVLAMDRATFLAQQGNGIYKMSATYDVPQSNLQSVVVGAPNGGESVSPGDTLTIRWSARDIALAGVEWRPAPGQAWQPLATVEGYRGQVKWAVPWTPTNQAKVRVRDAWDGAPSDSSDGAFTIRAPDVAASPAALAFGAHDVGTSTLVPVTIHNGGTATLVIASVTTSSGVFRPGRSSLTISAGASDTTGVIFSPVAAVSSTDTLVLATNVAPKPVVRIPLSGTGQAPLRLDLTAPNGGESWPYGSVHNVTWASARVDSVVIDYRAGPAAVWTTIAGAWPAAGGSWAWTIPYAPTSQARVRIREKGGTLADSSAAVFSLTSSLFAAQPDTLDMGAAVVGYVVRDTLHVANPGTSPLSVTAVSGDNASFAAARSSLAVPAGGADTLTIRFAPTAVGPQIAHLTFSTNDPFSPHIVVVKGSGEQVLAVGEGDGIPPVTALRQNRPNPFAGRTEIRYSLAAAGPVTLEVFGLRGERVALLVDGVEGPGEHTVEFGTGAATAGGGRIGPLPSGVYFIRLKAGSYSQTHRMLLLR